MEENKKEFKNLKDSLVSIVEETIQDIEKTGKKVSGADVGFDGNKTLTFWFETTEETIAN